MLIESQETPNPAVMKFLPAGMAVAGSAPAFEVANAESAAAIPVARALFAIPGIASVFFGRDFISVAKTPDYSWQQIRPDIMGVILDHALGGAFDLGPDAKPGAKPDDNAAGDAADEVESEIRRILDDYVRPAVAADGGDVIFASYAGGVLHLQMRGACAGCPSSALTLKQGIENLMKHYVPAVREVRAVELA